MRITTCLMHEDCPLQNSYRMNESHNFTRALKVAKDTEIASITNYLWKLPSTRNPRISFQRGRSIRARTRRDIRQSTLATVNYDSRPLGIWRPQNENKKWPNSGYLLQGIAKVVQVTSRSQIFLKVNLTQECITYRLLTMLVSKKDGNNSCILPDNFLKFFLHSE